MVTTDIERSVVASPLAQLRPTERAIVVATLNRMLVPEDAATILTALAGSRAEVAALPWALQRRGQEILLGALPSGINAVVVASLALCAIPTEEWLPKSQAEINALSLEEAVAVMSGPVRMTEDDSVRAGAGHAEDQAVSLSEAGRRLGVSRQRVRELIDSGKLPAVVRPVLAVRPADVERLAREERRPGRPRKRPTPAA